MAMWNISDSSLFMPRAYLKRSANFSVEALLLVCIIHEVPNVDVAYVGEPHTLQRAEHFLKGDTVLVYTVGNEQAGDPARRIPGRPQQGVVSYLSLVGAMSHASTNRVVMYMTTTIYDSLLRTF